MRSITVGRFFTYFSILLLSVLVSSCQGIALLDPQGPIGAQERDLIVIAIGLSLLVILPVFGMVAVFTLRYRESNTKATYKPHWHGNLGIEAVIWLVPVAIILVLSYLTWVKTTDLDPYKPIASVEKPLRVQVISMDWNWLFIYPDYNLATVNMLTMPVGVPVTFDLTSATVMSSIFIPELGSQMYAMAGMVSHLNLLADKPGEFTGYNMVFSGRGYDNMNFATKAVTKEQFEAWVAQAKSGTADLNLDSFKKTLNIPQNALPIATYSTVETGLFDHVVNLFMLPRGVAETEEGHSEASMSDMTNK